MFLNVELELALVAIQKCLNLLPPRRLRFKKPRKLCLINEAPLRRASLIIVILFGTPAILGEGEVIMSNSHEIAGQVLMCINWP